MSARTSCRGAGTGRRGCWHNAAGEWDIRGLGGARERDGLSGSCGNG